MVERKKKRETGSVMPQNKAKTKINQTSCERISYETFREVLLSLLTPRSSSPKRTLCVLKRVPMDMASLERGKKHRFHWKNKWNGASHGCVWDPENEHHRQEFEQDARTVTGDISSSAGGSTCATWMVRTERSGVETSLCWEDGE
jgi:hypothetical protein